MADKSKQPDGRDAASANARDGKSAGASQGALGWINGHRLVIALAVGAALIVPAVLILDPSATEKDTARPAKDVPTLEQALRALDSDNFGLARQLAMKLHYQAGPEQLGGPAFVLGATAAYEADTLWGKNKLSRHARAASHLEEARDRGFPKSREGEGLYLLGRSLYRSNQIPASQAVLSQALRLGKEAADQSNRLEILRMLAETYLLHADSGAQNALEFSREYLEHEDLSQDDKDEGLLRHARILFKLDRSADCRDYLGRLSPNAANLAKAMVIKGRLLMRESEKLAESEETDETTKARIDSLYTEAMSVFKNVQEHYSAGDVARSQAHYLTGVCLRMQGKQNEAITELRKVRVLNANSGEGIVAALTEADLLRELNQDDAAIRRYRDTVQAVITNGSLNNPWISLDDLRQNLLDAFGGYIAAEKFEHAVQMADLLSPLVRATQAIQLTGQAQVAWAQALDHQISTSLRTQEKEVQREARKHYREAGQIYARLARLRFATRDYPDDLWDSAESFRMGHDYSNAISMFDEYLKNESRKRISAAQVGLGESYLALSNLDKAIETLTTCVEDHPEAPSKYRARILAAEAHRERGDIEIAEAFLRSNLYDRHLGPKSQEWQASIFALGKLLHMAGRHQDAIKNLVEAVGRYPDSPQSMEAQYLIAESYRQAARQPLELLKKATIETSKRQHIDELKKLLAKSEEFYEAVRQDLNLRPDSVTLTTLESSILRNCYFALGAVYFDQGSLDEEYYDRAIRAYSDATNLYQHSPEVLEAFVQIAACHRRLDKPIQARQTLEQAKVVLKQLDPSLDFERTTNFTQQQWGPYLQELISFSK